MPETAAALILAGGEARRFPGKLERELDGTPLLLHVYRAMRQTGMPVYVAGKGSFAPDVDARLECPLLLDRWPGRGPFYALLSACEAIPQERIFVVAGDEPNVDATLPAALAAAWEEGDEAVVPEHDGRIEPLAAFYERSAVLHYAFTTAGEHRAAMHDFVERLRSRRVRVPSRYFANVNTSGDWERAVESRRRART